jgi:hypothetical protein
MSRISSRQLFVTFVPACLLLIALGVLGLGMGKNIGQFLREPMATAGLHPLAGVFSNLGVLMWAASASICLFAGFTIRDSGQGEIAGFLRSSGYLSAYLCCDDFFQVHEALIPTYLGIDEMYVYAAIATLVSMYLVFFGRLILSTSYLILIIAIAFLSTSVAIDAVFEPMLHGLGQGRIYIEDGTKFLGITAWCSYYVGTAHEFLIRAAPTDGQTVASAVDQFASPRAVGSRIEATRSQA